MKITKQVGWMVAALVVTLWPGTAFAQNNSCASSANGAVDDLREFSLQEGTVNASERRTCLLDRRRVFGVDHPD